MSLPAKTEQTMHAHYHAVIMAGGSGTRLWPLSRRQSPKHLLALLESDTLFQSTVARLQGAFPPERTWVVTVREQAEALQQQVPALPTANYLPEPAPRGTASVVGLAAIALRHRDPEAVMAVLPSDHFIRHVRLFHRLLEAAYLLAEEGFLVTLGITPTYPATGYGYIQRGEALGIYNDLKAYRVRRFKEKPDQATAHKMLAEGGHSWNSGMFVWRADAILAEIRRQMPDLAAALDEIAAAWGTPQQEAVLTRVWPTLRTETVDYGIMEGARDVAVIPAQGLGWNDVGSWESLFDVLSTDADGNILRGGEHMSIDARDNLVFVQNGQRKLVAVLGVENVVVVDTEDALLVCSRDQSQRVKEIVQQLKASGKDDYL